MKTYVRPLIVSVLVGCLGGVCASRLTASAKAAPPPPLSECDCRTASVYTSMSTASGPQAVPLHGATVAHCRCGTLNCVATFYNAVGTGTAISCH